MPKGTPIAPKVVACVATLLLSGATYAQSSVTLYGIVDGGLLYTSKAADVTT